jgi:hypothetical protein
MTDPPGERGPNGGEVGSVASNGEIVPDESASAESLRRQADEHPASNSQAASDHVRSRQGDEPTGLTRDSKTQNSASQAARRPRSTGHVRATAEERAVVAAGGEAVATSLDDQPEYEGPNSL